MIQVRIPGNVRERMKQALRRADRREIGGILMGQELSAGHFLLVDFSLDEKSGSAAHFVRDTRHHLRALEAFFQQTGRDYQKFNYLGEWHSHPCFPARPSIADLCSMQELVDGERGIEFAVLLIVKLTFWRRFVSTATLHRRGLAPEPVTLIG